jgi:hypothetical protein
MSQHTDELYRRYDDYERLLAVIAEKDALIRDLTERVQAMRSALVVEAGKTYIASLRRHVTPETAEWIKRRMENQTGARWLVIGPDVSVVRESAGDA